ncbi:uncharacterized protein LOC127795637 [Diospyros lotus]|uniref:uncharacterized protein LOC127795637 n=1 Tax=Diospyros lotus TaxID=55363 RepID=UPI00224E973F|nr:uncharacterized protein LOC127795637 [Diospyros lotus]
MNPRSLHSNFFSSLKQVEKRMKSESPSKPFSFSSPPGETNNSTPMESRMSSPLYLKLDQPSNSNTKTSTSEDSEPPREFLSNSLDFPPIQEDPSPPKPSIVIEDNGVDEIGLLIQLLGLSDCEEKEPNLDDLVLKNDDDGGFYARIVRVKGPKCVKESERLDGWIKHFLDDGERERREPLKLAHLLLGKAAFLFRDNEGFGGLDFPSTIDEFLQSDPPSE